MNFLLNDEKVISSNDLKIREELYNNFKRLPIEFVSKMRHLQPQIGCFNNCGFCSKYSICKSEYWGLTSLRNIIAAIKYTSLDYSPSDSLLCWDRKEHRSNVIYPYLNNDIAIYPFLYDYISLCYKDLGVRTRLSTVGFSRHNKHLNEMHKKICNSELIMALGGVRLSISQYGRVWEDGKNSSLIEYQKDITNFLQTYKPYYNFFGSGARKMCVEIRYNPLVELSDVFIFENAGKFIIATSNYLYISQENNIKFKEAFIKDPFVHAINLTEKSIKFNEYNLPFKVTEKETLIKYINNSALNFEKEVDVYLFSNKDGAYYAIDPKIKNTGNYGINIYPKSEIRKSSGYIITERFLLNAIYKFKSKKNMHLRDAYLNSTWSDVNEVLDICQQQIFYYENKQKKEKATYIAEHVLPVIRLYTTALMNANYSSDCFFDSKFTIDTGIICNLGRAIKYFKGLTNFVNEPLTPTHERNYGRHCSTMKQENCVWKLGCDYNDIVRIEKLDMFNTATVEGQVSYRHDIFIKDFNDKIIEGNKKFLFPGEVK